MLLNGLISMQLENSVLTGDDPVAKSKSAIQHIFRVKSQHHKSLVLWYGDHLTRRSLKLHV